MHVINNGEVKWTSCYETINEHIINISDEASQCIFAMCIKIIANLKLELNVVNTSNILFIRRNKEMLIYK